MGGCLLCSGSSLTSQCIIASSLVYTISDKLSWLPCEECPSYSNSHFHQQWHSICAINYGTIIYMKQSYMKWHLGTEIDLINNTDRKYSQYNNRVAPKIQMKNHHKIKICK